MAKTVRTAMLTANRHRGARRPAYGTALGDNDTPTAEHSVGRDEALGGSRHSDDQGTGDSGRRIREANPDSGDSVVATTEYGRSPKTAGPLPWVMHMHQPR